MLRLLFALCRWLEARKDDKIEVRADFFSLNSDR